MSNCLPKLIFISITAGFIPFRSSGKLRRLNSLPSKHRSSSLCVLISFKRGVVFLFSAFQSALIVAIFPKHVKNQLKRKIKVQRILRSRHERKFGR